MQHERISSWASLVAIVISLGTIFYHAVVVQRDVQYLSKEFDKTEKKITEYDSKIDNNQQEIKLLITKFENINNQTKAYDSQITEINRQILKSSQEVREMLLKSLLKVEK